MAAAGLPPLEINRLRKASCIFAIVGAAVLITLATVKVIHGTVMNSRAGLWPVEDGQVESVIVEPRYAHVNYSYAYGQTRYTGRKLSYLLRGSIAERQYILDTYQPKMKVGVHVNPDGPNESVLEYRTPVFDYIQNDLFIIATLSVFSIITAALLLKESKISRPSVAASFADSRTSPMNGKQESRAAVESGAHASNE